MSNNLLALRKSLIQHQEGYDLENVVEWNTKFVRQLLGAHPPFSPGELVRVKGFIKYDEDGLRLHVDDDGRVADNFYMVNPIDAEKAKAYCGLPLESVVRVLQFREQSYRISNIQNYTAGLIDVTSFPLINPTQTEAEVTANTQAVIYGQFVRFTESGEDRFLRSLGLPEGTRITGEDSTSTRTKLSIKLPDGKNTSITVDNPSQDYRDSATHAVIRTEDGREIEIHNPTGRIAYSGGTIENITDKLPEQGDVLRISAKICDGTFFANRGDPCFLVDPSDDRYARMNDLQIDLEHNLDTAHKVIAEGKYADARTILAETRTREVTEAQLDRTYELAKSIPITERPVLTDKKEYSRSSDKNYLVDSIDGAFGVRVESMTAKEFTAFAKRALAGDIAKTGNDADTTYLLTLASHMGFDATSIEDLAIYAIQGRIQRMAETQGQDFNDEYVIGQTINTIYNNKTPNAAKIIVDAAELLQAAGLQLPYEVREYKQILLEETTPLIGNV
ncbi:TPA: sulfotransferase [Candidatus Woesearchaeota archaeon]|nr:sulfotransferase [Candidatus Woesearchaeota archaeon]